MSVLLLPRDITYREIACVDYHLSKVGSCKTLGAKFDHGSDCKGLLLTVDGDN